MEKLKRRTFIKLGASGIGSLYFPLCALAQEDESTLPKHDFIVAIRLDGGWDTTLGTDPWLSETPPKPEDLFIEYSQSDLIVNSNNYRFGPAFTPLKKYLDRLTVINGIFMSPTDNGHQALSTYGLSGNGQGELPAVPVAVYQQHEGPFGLVSGSYPYVGKTPVPKISPYNLRNSTALEFKNHVISAYGSMSSDSPLGRAFTLIKKESKRLDKAKSILEELKESGIEVNDYHAVASAFASGTSYQAYIDINPQVQTLDSHTNHEGSHILAQQDCFSQVNNLLDALGEVQIGNSGQSVLDRTTLMITSEFTRTPALNNAAGKDHNPFTNSYLVMGPNIKGGLKIGGSHIIPKEKSFLSESYHAAKPIDLDTLEVLNEKRGTILKPEIVCKTLWTAMGLRQMPQQWKRHPIIDHLIT